MKIGIRLDRDDFMYDIHSLVKSFFQDDDVSVFTEDNSDKCSEEWNLLFSVSIPSYERDGGRKEAKDTLKRELYDLLTAYTGKELPWGMLSGIRPAKIPMKLLLEGKSKPEIISFMRNHYAVSEEKAGLALAVAEKEAELLGKTGTGEDTYSLYINIPFCPSICLYCTFSSSPADLWENRMDEYLDLLTEDMKNTRKRLAEEGKRPGPVTIYIGGGTPTALNANRLERLLTAVAEIWDMSGVLEYTVEAGRPDSITGEKLEVLRRFGITRISVNPQTMNDDTLKLIGRGHSTADTVRAFHLAREAGFDNINMDMILGLPGEGEQEVSHTLDEIMKLRPDSLTVHSLAVKRASRLRRTMLEDREKDADADRGNYGGLIFENSENLMRKASLAAASMGMVPYYMYRQKNMKGNLENTGFSLPGKECLYNIIIMEEVQTIYAFGAGASTKFVYPDGRIERKVEPKDVRTWLLRRK